MSSPPKSTNSTRLALGGLLVLALAGGAYVLWSQPGEPAPPEPVPQAQPVGQTSVVAAPVPAVDPPAPAIRHPVEVVEAPTPVRKPLPALGQSDPRLLEEFNTLLGRKKVQQFLLMDSFARRVVATIDNLGREHAAPSMWPVHPMPGRFTTLRRAEGEVINPDNSLRYGTLIQFIETVDSRQAVQLYAALYPLFQQAYVELGYPKDYFNDRLIAVIDLLLSTRVYEQPLLVELVEVKGPYPSERPWTRYAFADEDLQSLAAGQKMLLRTGAANHRRLRAKLIEIRGLLTKAELPKGVRP